MITVSGVFKFFVKAQRQLFNILYKNCSIRQGTLPKHIGGPHYEGRDNKLLYFLNCVPKITYLCSKLCDDENTHKQIHNNEFIA